MIRQIQKIFFLFIPVFLVVSCTKSIVDKPSWPEIHQQTRPWTRWWWPGSAVTEKGITQELEAFQKAGLGGVEITPIYGVYGYEDQFVKYLSPRWVELLTYTLKEARRLDLGVDMATGTGWPFGGPWIGYEDACKNINYKVYQLKGGEKLHEKIFFNQPAYLSLVGNQLYEVSDTFGPKKEKTAGARKEPALTNIKKKPVTLDELIDPVSANKNLQALALNQVKFPKPLKLHALMAYSDRGDVVDLTAQVDEAGELNWIAPEGTWKLYALFIGSHGKMVERAAPGGEGNVIDHFSSSALHHYLQHFDSAFAGHDISYLRCFFNDSYEVDDARGSADWTPTLLDEFKKRRGYDLRHYLPQLLDGGDSDSSRRILCDYRETISELLADNFTTSWKKWAHSKDAMVRNQAHGSPANILDLYGIVDIPEIEGVEPLRTKMASSSAHVMGKKLVSSESATWLNEHFESNLSDIKVVLDRFMLNGVNHIFYHGTAYSPPDEAWPGWLFYAAVHLDPRNSLWPDVHKLNEYVARCQSMLQDSAPDDDILLYYPVYDGFSHRGRELIEHFDGIGEQFKNTPFADGASYMLDNGYSFDYISDKQIHNCRVDKGKILTEGESSYQVIVVPHGDYIPVQTLKKVFEMAHQGSTVIFYPTLPESISGFSNLDKNLNTFDSLKNILNNSTDVAPGIKELKTGDGVILVGEPLEQLLSHADVRRESFGSLKFLRKKKDDNKLYFLANNTDTTISTSLTLSVPFSDAVLYNPMTGEIGEARISKEDGNKRVVVHLLPQETIFVETYSSSPGIATFPYRDNVGEPVVIRGPWKIQFLTGGPLLPKEIEQDTAAYWTTEKNEDYRSFSGTASYTCSFPKPKDNNVQGWWLNLGDVKESAEVILNGKNIGTTIGPTYRVFVEDSLVRETNTLTVNVCNLMANRIAYLDRHNIFWKKFYNVNFPARLKENRKNNLFDASEWQPHASGLNGPVILSPVK